MQEYSLTQLGVQIGALKGMFDDVTLVDLTAGATLDAATLQPIGRAPAVPPLDESGRAWQPQRRGDSTALVFYDAVLVEGRPCVLCAVYDLPQTIPSNSRDANAFLRLLNQYHQELRHDYVTGVYNRRFLDEDYRDFINAQAAEGRPISAVLARVNEYAALCSTEGAQAADCCLNTAAGILQIAVGMDREAGVLIRLEDGLFLAVCIGKTAAETIESLRDTLANSRRWFSLSLSRRGEFTVALAGADWAEAPSLDLLLSLAERRLG